MATALAIAGMFVAGSATGTTRSTDDIAPVVAGATVSHRVGLLTTNARPIQFVRTVLNDVGDAPVSRSPARAESPTAPSAQGIPAVALAAYRNAELVSAQTEPRCGIDWSLLAGIGRIESGHADGGNTDAEGTTLAPIFGPALDGTLAGNEVIADGQGSYIRAIGPMQFLPSTWTAYASDGNGDGHTDPSNIFDATLAAARYLCSGGLDLRDPAQRLRAVLRYNNSTAYASDVLGWASNYTGNGSAPIEIAVVDVAESTGTHSPGAATEPLTESIAQPTASDEPNGAPTTPPAEPPMIEIPGLPPIPCGILCPPPGL